MDELNNNILEKLSGKEQYEYYQEKVEEFFEKYIITEIKNRNIKMNGEQLDYLANKLIKVSEDLSLIKRYDENKINIFLKQNTESKKKFAREFIDENISM